MTLTIGDIRIAKENISGTNCLKRRVSVFGGYYAEPNLILLDETSRLYSVFL